MSNNRLFPNIIIAWKTLQSIRIQLLAKLFFLSLSVQKNVVQNNSSSGWFFIYLFQFDRFMFKILAHGPSRVLNARILSTISWHYKITGYFCESHTSLVDKLLCKWKFRKPTRGVQWLLFLLSLCFIQECLHIQI